MIKDLFPQLLGNQEPKGKELFLRQRGFIWGCAFTENSPGKSGERDHWKMHWRCGKHQVWDQELWSENTAIAGKKFHQI